MKKIRIIVILTVLIIQSIGVIIQGRDVYGESPSSVRLYDKGPVQVRLPDKSEMDRIRKDKGYQYDTNIVQGKTILDIIAIWLMEHLFSVITSKESGLVFRIITYVIMAAALAAAIIVLRRGNFFGLFSRKGVSKGDVRSDVDEDIHGLDYDAIIKKYTDAGEFRMALRYRFLKTLNFLSINGIIEWQKEKTNRDYIKEVQSKIPASSFEEIVRIFEYVWYGDFSIDRDYLEQLYAQFYSIDFSLDKLHE